MNQRDVLNELIRIKTGSSFGPDELHLELTNGLAPVITGPDFEIFIKSLKTGILLDDLKCVNINKIFKGCASHLLANYGPVSITGVLINVLERLPKRLSYPPYTRGWILRPTE